MCCKTKKCIGGATIINASVNGEIKVVTVHELAGHLAMRHSVSLCSPLGWVTLKEARNRGLAKTAIMDHWPLFLTTGHKVEFFKMPLRPVTRKADHRQTVFELYTEISDAVFIGPYIVAVTKLEKPECHRSKAALSS